MSVITGIYNRIGPKEQGSDEQLLISDEKAYTLAVRTFSQGDQIYPNFIPLNVSVGESVVRVLVDKGELAKKLGLASAEQIPDSGTEAFVQEKILNTLKGKAFDSSELEKFEDIEGDVLEIDKNVIHSFYLERNAVPDDAYITHLAQKKERLMEKFLRRHPELNEPKYLAKVGMASFLITYKTVEDPSLDNAAVGDFFGLEEEEINEIEELFIKGIGWDLSLSDVEEEQLTAEDLKTLRKFAEHRFSDDKMPGMFLKAAGNDMSIFDKITKKARDLRRIVRKKYPELKKKEYLQALKIASFYLACVHEGKRDLSDLEYAWNMDVNLDDLIELKTILMKGLKGVLPDVIKGIHHSIGLIKKRGKKQLLVSDEREYNLPVLIFSEQEAKDPNKIPLNIRLEEGVVKVLVDKAVLAERLGLEIGEEIPTEHVEQFVQEKILHDLKGEAYSDRELAAFKGVQGAFRGNKLILDEQQIIESLQYLKAKLDKKAFVRIHERFQEKLLRKHPELNKLEYLTGLRLASFVLAYKTVDDKSYNNKGIADLFGLSIGEINELEKLFIKGVDWDISLNDVAKEKAVREGGIVKREAEKGFTEAVKQIDIPTEREQFTDEDYKELILLSRRSIDSEDIDIIMDLASNNEDAIKDKIMSKTKELCDILIQNNPELSGNEYWPAYEIASFHQACLIEGTRQLDESEYVDCLDIDLDDLKKMDSILLKGLQEKISNKERKKLIGFSRHIEDPVKVDDMTLLVANNDWDIKEKIEKKAEELRAIATKKHPELKNRECMPALEMASLHLACIREGVNDLREGEYAYYLDTTRKNLGLLKSILLRALEE